MTTKMEALLLIGVMLALSFLFQIQLKIYAVEIGVSSSRAAAGWPEQIRLIAASLIAWRPLLLAVLGCCLLGTWLLVLARIELSTALPLISAGLVVNAIGGGLYLGEHVSWQRIAGTLLVATGSVLVVRS